MKKLIFKVILLFFAVVMWCSCGSSGYDIDEETTEAPKTETKTEIKEDLNLPKTEIKQEINKEISKSNLTTSNKSFTIQIGAFNVESNARDYAAYAESKLNYDVVCLLIDGLYKVRVGSFGNISDALNYLGKLRNEGFMDSFVTESK